MESPTITILQIPSIRLISLTSVVRTRVPPSGPCLQARSLTKRTTLLERRKQSASPPFLKIMHLVSTQILSTLRVACPLVISLLLVHHHLKFLGQQSIVATSGITLLQLKPSWATCLQTIPLLDILSSWKFYRNVNQALYSCKSLRFLKSSIHWVTVHSPMILVSRTALRMVDLAGHSGLSHLLTPLAVQSIPRQVPYSSMQRIWGF